MSKYAYLKDFAATLLSSNENLTIAQIARIAKDAFKLDDTAEQIRKQISRELNKYDITDAQSGVKQIDYLHVEGTKFPQATVTTTTTGTGYVSFLPEKKEERKQIFKEPGQYIVLGCAHVPGHNVSMMNGVTKLIGDIQPKGLMLIGDFLDLNSLSGHDKGKFTSVRGMTLTDEYAAGNKILNQLCGELEEDTELVYIYGNHEDRWNRYMSDMQNAKTPLPSPKEALSLEVRGFNVFERWSSDYVKLGSHLELIHGQYYNTHCAKQHIDKFRGSVLFAHTHRIQMYVEGSTAGFNIGWGGDVNHPFFNYAERGTKSQWQNGFAIVTIDEEGNYYVQQIFHYNNKFYYNGKKYN